MIACRMRRTGVSANIALRTERGTKPNSAALTRIVICGACAAREKVLSRSPTRIGVGSVRWKHLPSSFGRCAMWSIAAATKSTGTTLMRPPSRPIAGIHEGRNLRVFWISLKK